MAWRRERLKAGRLGVRLTVAVEDAVREAARREGRPVSAIVEAALVEWLARREAEAAGRRIRSGS